MVERATSFGAEARRYDAARPRYPDGALREIHRRTSNPKMILEIGCGTGILTRRIAAWGAVTAIDPDPQMLAVARRRDDRPTYLEGRFEDVELDGEFDLIVAGQSWHWVDTSTGFGRAFELLRPAGLLALLWNRPAPEGFQFRAELDAIYAQHAPSVAIGSNQAFTRTLDDELAALAIPSQFEEHRVDHYRWAERLGTAQYLELLRTHSDHITLEPARRERLLSAVEVLLDGHGGSIETRYRTLLVTARRPGNVAE